MLLGRRKEKCCGTLAVPKREASASGAFHGLVSGCGDCLFAHALLAVSNSLYWSVMLLVWAGMRRICAAHGCCPSDAGRAWWGAARLWTRSPASSLWTHAHSKPASPGLQAEQSHFEGSTSLCGVWLGLCQAQAASPQHLIALGMDTQLLLLTTPSALS